MNLGFLEATGLAPLPAFLTSLALGLLIGLERERNPASKAGLRTFALVALLGTLASLIGLLVAVRRPCSRRRPAPAWCSFSVRFEDCHD